MKLTSKSQTVSLKNCETGSTFSFYRELEDGLRRWTNSVSLKFPGSDDIRLAMSCLWLISTIEPIALKQ